MSKNEIDVSVIIPTFNRKKFLYPTLLCLIHQNIFKCAYEVIIIDSGNDGTEQVVNSLKPYAGDALVYERMPENRNRSLLRNRGAEIAAGSILIFIDNDMMVHPDFIETHFSWHKNREKPSVLLGKRKSLTEFDFTAVGEKTLTSDFESLDNLQWYDDIRDRYFGLSGDEYDIAEITWTGFYSHSFSIEKEVYEKLGGFNGDFGINWGYEDIELGFRCFKNNIPLFFERKIPSYHQTHFEETNSTKGESFHNLKIFLQLHNSFEMEIGIFFSGMFKQWCAMLNEIRERIDQKRLQQMELDNYDLVLGFLNTVKSDKIRENAFLGISLPIYGKGSLEKVLVLKEYREFPATIKLTILHEALRIGQHVYLEKWSKIDEKALIGDAKDLGYEIELIPSGPLYEINIKRNLVRRFYKLLFPDACVPRDRFFSMFVADKLIQSGYHISHFDPHGVAEFGYEDLTMNADSVNRVRSCFRNSYAAIGMKMIVMADMEGSPAYRNVQHTGMIVFDNNSYRKNIGKTSDYYHFHYTEKDIESLSFLAMLEAVNENKEYLGKTEPDPNSICCFMENGYLEDGLDIILTSFATLCKEHSKAGLTIKMPDYDKLTARKFSIHNEASRKAKTFIYSQKFATDYFRLMSCIQSLGLENNVTVIKDNLPLRDCLKILKGASVYVNASRGTVVPIEAYAALILGIKTLLPLHCRAGGELSEFITGIESAESGFAGEFLIPVSSRNINLVACRASNEAMSAALKKNMGSCELSMIPHETVDILRSRAEKIVNDFGTAESQSSEGSFAKISRIMMKAVNGVKQ